MDWTSDQIQRLRDLWAEGHSAAEIARRMRISKNAAVGKAHRLDLAARPSPIRRDANATPRTPQPPRAGRETLPPLVSVQHTASPPARQPIAAPRPTPSRSTLPPLPSVQTPVSAFPADTTSYRPKRHRDGTGCCYPIGEPGTRGFRYCDADLSGASYCADHARLCTIRVRRSEVAA